MSYRLSPALGAIFHTRHGDLRVVWRLVLFLILATLVATLLYLVLEPAGLPAHSLQGPVMLAGLLGSTAFMTRRVNGKPFGAAGLGRSRGAGRDFALGCFLGLLMMGGIFLIERALGYVDLESRDLSLPVILWIAATSALFFSIGALAEELLFRGYAFQTLMQGITFLPATLGTSVLFALGHLGNPNANIFGLVNVGLAGLWLSFAYLKTRTLWLPFGLHFSWNFCQTTLFAFPTSGMPAGHLSPFLSVQGGPAWITGGAFGPEGGALATIAILLCTGHLLKSPLYRRREGVITLDSVEDLIGPTDGNREAE